MLFYTSKVYSCNIARSASHPILKKGSMTTKPRVTRNDVAEHAGVSTAVVSYVMNNGPQPVAEKTRARVLQAVADLGYRADHVARSLRMQRTNTLGVLISNSTNPYYAEIAKDIENSAFNLGYSILVGNTSNNLERQQLYLESFVSRKVDGIIFVSTVLTNEAIDLIRKFRIPALYIGSEGDLEADVQALINCIQFNGQEGGYIVGRHLLERGHQRLACIVGAVHPFPFTNMRWLRLEGFSQVLNEAGLQPQVIRQGETYLDGYLAARTLLETKAAPTAIFAGNDLIAIGVLRAAADLGLSVPGDLAVCGFDDIEAASFSSPRLTTMRIPRLEIAENALHILVEQIESWKKAEEIDRSPVIDRDIKVQLIVREST